jgi:hypothetical protein
LSDFKRREQELRASRQFRWGSALLKVATLGRSKQG